MDRLFEPVGLKSLHIDHGYEWQLKVLENWHPSINETQGVFATSPDSPANVTLLDPVVVNITVSEIGVHWVFSVSPQGGWAARRDGSFTIQLVLVAVFTVIGGMGMGCATVASVRANYKERVLASEQHAALTLDARAAELAKVARSRLIRTVMHDLRSPLLSIANLSRSLRAAPGSTQISELGKLPDYMLSCSSIMESIVSDMLDFERIEAGQISLTFAPLRVHELVNGAMAIFLARPTQAHDRPFARAHLIGIATLKGIQLDAPAPEGLAASTVLLADGLRLQQCMQNGLSNVINFTEQGKSVRLRTAVELNKDRPGWAQLTVSVQDEGIGLSERELGALGKDRMFTQMQGNGGTGIGLPIVRELLRKHSGLLVLSSEGYGKGTCFEMRVDCEIDSTVAPDLEQPSALKAPTCLLLSPAC
ncbi:histidine kinase-like ATPase [Pavlovales sp. CCMP2436]|nr:histidine kinase-like ATPase [Pavlovales sp. CCMP2436]